MYDALFREVGAIRAQTFSDLLDIPAALATGRRLRGRGVAVLTSTGGAGTLVADSLGSAAFETPAPDAATAAALRALQSGDHAVLDRNPIDVTLAGLQPTLLRGAIKALLASPSYDAAIVIVGSSGLAMPHLMADAIHDCLPASDKPLLVYVSPHAPAIASLLNSRGVPAFTAPESCTSALSAMLEQERWAPPAEQVALPSARVDDLPDGSLNEAQAKQLFSRFGVPCAREAIVSDAAGAVQAAREFGGPVVLKILSSEITHKSDVGGVAVNVSADHIAARLERMTDDVEARAGVRPRQFLVQEMVSGGVELILGLHRDQLGAAVLLGMGCRRAASRAPKRKRWCANSRHGRCSTAFEAGRRPMSTRWSRPSSRSRRWPRCSASASSKPRSTRCSCCPEGRACARSTGWPCWPRSQQQETTHHELEPRHLTPPL
jgi:acyl-CoA synthetase (NDP forming)